MSWKRNAMPHVGVVGGSIGRTHRGPRAARPGLRGGRVRAFGDRAGSARRGNRAAPDDHPLLRRIERAGRSHGRDRAAVAEIPLRERGAGLPRTHELPLLVLEHDLSRPRGLFRRAPLPPRLRSRGLQSGRSQRHHHPEQRRDADPRHAGVRGWNLVRHPRKAAARGIDAVRGLRRVAGDGPRIRADSRELRGVPRLNRPTACFPPGTYSSIPSRTSTAPSSPAGGSRTSSGTTTTRRAIPWTD